MESKPQAELIRIAYGTVNAVDFLGCEPGRGMYICKSDECLKKAIKKNSFQRASKGKVNGQAVDDIVAALEMIIQSDNAEG